MDRIGLHNFQGGINDGAAPQSGLVFDSAGNLYGATDGGGANERSACFSPIFPGCGTVFQLSPPATVGGAWTETILHSFNYGQGTGLRSTLILDAKGDLYGAAEQGGLYHQGTLYRLVPPATPGAAWTFKVLHAFNPTFGSAEGLEPFGALTLRGKGVLYGTTAGGGTYGEGTVFELVPPVVAGGAWTENILYSFGFGGGGNDGGAPESNLIFDAAGSMYGTTIAGGGTENTGTVFKLIPPASSGADWTETVLHSFPATAKDVAIPSGGLLLGKNGVLYGVARVGSSGSSAGAIFGVTK